MNDEFVTAALENDRYLKAIRMVNRFEEEIRGELERIGNEIVDENPDLFVDGVKPSWNNDRSSGTVIAFARVDYEMDRVRSVEQSSNKLKLNISLRWIDPADWGYQDTDGALFVTSYKIKNASQDDFETVKQETLNEDWDCHFAKDQFNNAPGVTYIPVETAADITDAHEILKEHFSKFGRSYGVDPEEIVSGK